MLGHIVSCAAAPTPVFMIVKTTKIRPVFRWPHYLRRYRRKSRTDLPTALQQLSLPIRLGFATTLFRGSPRKEWRRTWQTHNAQWIAQLSCVHLVHVFTNSERSQLTHSAIGSSSSYSNTSRLYLCDIHAALHCQYLAHRECRRRRWQKGKNIETYKRYGSR